MHQLNQLAESGGDEVDAEKWVGLDAENGIEISVAKPVLLGGSVTYAEGGIEFADSLQEKTFFVAKKIIGNLNLATNGQKIL